MTKEQYLKHKEVIDAWANGTKIQYKNLLGVWTDEDEPYWFEDTEYRVKPVPTFKVGDKVLFVKEWKKHNIQFDECFKKVIGKIGTVININPFNGCNVKFDNFMWKYENSFAIPNECLQSVEYVPFTFEDDLVGNKVKNKLKGFNCLIVAQTPSHLAVYENGWTDYEELLEDFEFLDGSPCGKLKQ